MPALRPYKPLVPSVYFHLLISRMISILAFAVSVELLPCAATNPASARVDHESCACTIALVNSDAAVIPTRKVDFDIPDSMFRHAAARANCTPERRARGCGILSRSNFGADRFRRGS